MCTGLEDPEGWRSTILHRTKLTVEGLTTARGGQESSMFYRNFTTIAVRKSKCQCVWRARPWWHSQEQWNRWCSRVISVMMCFTKCLSDVNSVMLFLFVLYRRAFSSPMGWRWWSKLTHPPRLRSRASSLVCPQKISWIPCCARGSSNWWAHIQFQWIWQRKAGVEVNLLYTNSVYFKSTPEVAFNMFSILSF